MLISILILILILILTCTLILTNLYCMDAGDFYIVGTTKGDLYVIRQETG